MKNEKERKDILLRLAIESILVVKKPTTESVAEITSLAEDVVERWLDRWFIMFNKNALIVYERGTKSISREEESTSISRVEELDT